MSREELENAGDIKQGSRDPAVVQIEEDIARTRANMSGTISELETRLNPTEVKEKLGAEWQHVEDRVRVVVREQLGEAKALVQAELSEAKSLLREEMNEAEEKVKRGLGEARDAIKQDVKDAFIGAKHAVRAATLGQVEDLATTIGDKMNEARDTLVDTVKSNPIPAALVGVGLAWLLMNRSKSAQGYARGADGSGAQRMVDRVGDVAGQAGTTVTRFAHDVTGAATDRLHQAAGAATNIAQHASETTSQLAHQAGDAAMHLAEQAGDAASSLADGAKRGARRVEATVSDTLQENPMVLGVAALALGAVVGFSLPSTQREDLLLGETRDKLLGQAGEAAQSAASSVTQLAGRALENVKKTGQEARSTAS